MVTRSPPLLGPHSRGHLPPASAEPLLYVLPRVPESSLSLEDKSLMSPSQRERVPSRLYLHVTEGHRRQMSWGTTARGPTHPSLSLYFTCRMKRMMAKMTDSEPSSLGHNLSMIQIGGQH